MKLFKKVTAALLGLTMSFSLFACGGGDNTSSSSKGGSEGGLIGGGNLEDGDGAKYLEGAIDAFMEANTITVEFDLVSQVSDTESFTADVEIDATYVLAKTENGYNMSFKGVFKETEDGESSEDPAEVYIVDGWVYEYDDYEEAWQKYSLADSMPEGFDMISEIYNMLTSEDADLSQVYELLGPILEEFCYIENDAYNFELDLKDEVNAAIDYIANLDYSQTLEAYLNSVLDELGADTTVKDILDEVATYGSYTVGEAYADLNDLLEKEIDMDVNGLKNELVKELKALDLSMVEDYVPAEYLEELSAMITMVEGMDIDALVADFAEISVDDLVSMMLGGAAGGPATYSEEQSALKALVNSVYQMLSTTSLEDMFTLMGMREFTEIAEELGHASISDLSESLSIKFNGYKISSVSYDAKIGCDYNNSPRKAGAAATVSCNVSLSSAVTEIKVPEGAAGI